MYDTCTHSTNNYHAHAKDICQHFQMKLTVLFQFNMILDSGDIE